MTTESKPGSSISPPAALRNESASKKARVLVVEDEGGLRRLLRYCLERSGYEMLEAVTGAQALEVANHSQPNAVLLDMSLPDMNGMVVLNRLREWTQIPILVLSENVREEEKVTALDSGANDCIAKPFGTAELLARLRAAQRYANQTQQPKVFCSGDLTVDLVNRTVRVKGQSTKLTPTEYSLLHLFVQHAGKVLTHRQIFRAIWGPAETENLDYIRVYLNSLRNKLARELIVTEPGIGYRLAVAGED